jgi:uncharacterized protein YbjT (DUF2867 family)
VAPEAWSWVALGDRRAVAARALSDEGDNPGLTDRVGPPISEREATAESDKRSRRRSKRTSRQATAEMDKRSNDGPTGPDREGGGAPRLGWKIWEEAGPKPSLGLKSNRVKENQF